MIRTDENGNVKASFSWIYRKDVEKDPTEWPFYVSYLVLISGPQLDSSMRHFTHEIHLDQSKIQPIINTYIVQSVVGSEQDEEEWLIPLFNRSTTNLRMIGRQQPPVRND